MDRERILTKRVQNEEGFTLIELMVVLIILGLLAAIVGPRIMDKPEKAKIKTTAAQIAQLGTALDNFNLDTGRYPTTSEGLQALVSNPGIEDWNGPYLTKSRVPLDPWRNEYRYEAPGSHSLGYDIISYGPDGVGGGDGQNADIVSWL